MICGEGDLILYEHDRLLACWLCKSSDDRIRGEQLLLRGLMCQVLVNLADGQFRVTQHGPMVYNVDEEIIN